jgi:hypothetical protein
VGAPVSPDHGQLPADGGVAPAPARPGAVDLRRITTVDPQRRVAVAAAAGWDAYDLVEVRVLPGSVTVALALPARAAPGVPSAPNGADGPGGATGPAAQPACPQGRPLRGGRIRTRQRPEYLPGEPGLIRLDARGRLLLPAWWCRANAAGRSVWLYQQAPGAITLTAPGVRP